MAEKSLRPKKNQHAHIHTYVLYVLDFHGGDFNVRVQLRVDVTQVVLNLRIKSKIRT